MCAHGAHTYTKGKALSSGVVYWPWCARARDWKVLKARLRTRKPDVKNPFTQYMSGPLRLRIIYCAIRHARNDGWPGACWFSEACASVLRSLSSFLLYTLFARMSCTGQPLAPTRLASLCCPRRNGPAIYRRIARGASLFSCIYTSSASPWGYNARGWSRFCGYSRLCSRRGSEEATIRRRYARGQGGRLFFLRETAVFFVIAAMVRAAC